MDVLEFNVVLLIDTSPKLEIRERVPPFPATFCPLRSKKKEPSPRSRSLLAVENTSKMELLSVTLPELADKIILPPSADLAKTGLAIAESTDESENELNRELLRVILPALEDSEIAPPLPD
jgi:hypothetical protein